MSRTSTRHEVQVLAPLTARRLRRRSLCITSLTDEFREVFADATTYGFAA